MRGDRRNWGGRNLLPPTSSVEYKTKLVPVIFLKSLLYELVDTAVKSESIQFDDSSVAYSAQN